MPEPKRMVVLPYDLQEGGENDIEETINEISNKKKKTYTTKTRQSRIIKIALILAINRAFDNDLHLKREDGSYNQESDLAQLLSLTQKKSRDFIGLSDLIRELYLAKIDPDLIQNEMIRERVLAYKPANSQPQSPPNSPEPPIQEKPIIRKILKRRNPPHYEEYESQTPNKKRIIEDEPPVNPWDIPFNDDDDDNEL
jgi:hypothetical protein